MATQIEKEAYKAGFKAGYANGRVAELTRADIETNAEAHYEEWRKKKDRGKRVGSRRVYGR